MKFASTISGLAFAFCLLLSACQPIQPTMPSRSSAKRAPDGPIVAFVRERSLYIFPGDLTITVEDCSRGCHLYYLTWSPDGERLAYFYSPATAGAAFEIRLADRSGQTQTVASNVGWFTPPAWSPQGDRLAYLVATDRYVVQEDVPHYLLEVWISEVLADGTLANPRKHGEISLAGDCAGNAQSESARLYENEGGLASGGYRAGILAWTAEDRLLYSNRCSAQGVGRFDLTTGVELEPYAGKLRSLALNRGRNRWVAIDERQELVTGSSSTLTYTALATQAMPELVFYDQFSDNLFYTTLTVTAVADLSAQLSEAQQRIPVSPYFEFTKPSVSVLDASGSERLLWTDDAYAYARIQQTADGTLYFSRISNSEALYAALREGGLTAEGLIGLRPGVDLLRLPPASDRPEVWLSNATQFALAPSPSVSVVTITR